MPPPLNPRLVKPEGTVAGGGGRLAILVFCDQVLRKFFFDILHNNVAMSLAPGNLAKLAEPVCIVLCSMRANLNVVTCIVSSKYYKTPSHGPTRAAWNRASSQSISKK